MIFERVYVLCGLCLVTRILLFFCLWTEIIADKNDECDDGERQNSVVRSGPL